MSTSDSEMRQVLLRAVKKEVKQIMEEAVTRKFVHEESSSITSLCGAVEACLLHGLKKRALGLFKLSTTMALLQKIAKNFEPAASVVKMVADAETTSEPSKKSLDNNKNQTKKNVTSYNPRYLWIRISIFEKQLAKILDYLVQNSSKFYEPDALIADPVDGPIFASLLVGPCALDYTKMKTSDHFWTDPPADELVQRHRIHSSGKQAFSASPGSPKRPGLQIKGLSSSSSEDSPKGTFHMSAREYVESLHQNSKTTLLYGKNNVQVQPVQKEDVKPLAGYLSLHESPDGLIIMWTPNQLMNGCCESTDEETDRRCYLCAYNEMLYGQVLKRKLHKTFMFWEFAMTVYVDEIVYIHCHQQPDCGGTIVLVGQDGVQRPPIHFPKGGHLLAFLSCLETGLNPRGQLDPPLWSQRGKGKVFPKMKRKGSHLSNEGSLGSSSSSADEEEATDYVFRIISSFKPNSITPEMMDPKAKQPCDQSPWAMRRQLPPSPLTQSSMQSYAKSQEVQNNTCLSQTMVQGGANHRAHIKQLCDTMRKQIISRAFYGWLAHCRHLKTVRTHLSGLVNGKIVAADNPHDAMGGLTKELWQELNNNGVVINSGEIYRLVYYGGVCHELRKEVWPYLLGHYKFGSEPSERETRDSHIQDEYERVMSEWLAVEAIVRQRDKEIMAANLAKLSKESNDGHIPLARKDSNLSNDVFESFDSEEFSHPETVVEESSTAMTTPTAERSSVSDVGCPVQKQDQVVQTDTPVHVRRISSLTDSPDDGLGDSITRGGSSTDRSKLDSLEDCEMIENSKAEQEGSADDCVVVTKLSVDSAVVEEDVNGTQEQDPKHDDAAVGAGKSSEQAHSADALTVEDGMTSAFEHDSLERLPSGKGQFSGVHLKEGSRHLSASKESLVSPASPASHGGIYSNELLEDVALNWHRIDKDVQRCDRNYWYFSHENLEKLRNVMCTYVWQHLDVGYVQGMCDLVAPLLVIFDDEALTYSCFCELMKRMSANFPYGGAMDTHFANMRSLIQILDSELFEHMHQHGDYTHFYFCYRWFLLDFKRELVYDDVFSVWETIWAAKHISSSHFVLFIALALVEYYRDIILDNNMDFTDIIKFFNEMAERHNAKQVLKISRDLVLRLQTLIENK